MSEIHFDPDVFHGELTANRAQLFVRAPRTPDLVDCTLHGFVHGPRCEYAHTLPARYALSDLGAGPTLLARTTITDPCLWTSDLPQIYDVSIELRRGNEVLASEKRMIGLRGIGGRFGSGGAPGEILREGKVWVPRGVDIAAVQHDVAQLREELLAGIVSSPPLDLLVEASRQGAYLIAHVAGSAEAIPAALRNLARWPAVMMAVVRGGESFDRTLQQVAPNLVLAQPVRIAEAGEFRPAAWAAAVVVETTEDQISQDLLTKGLAALRGCPLPLLVQRRAPISATGPRAECDRLQREMAQIGQFAGYLVDAT
jgi:hypothetical protein